MKDPRYIYPRNYFANYPLAHLDVKVGDPIDSDELAQHIRTADVLGFHVVATMIEPERGRAQLTFHAIPQDIEIRDA